MKTILIIGAIILGILLFFGFLDDYQVSQRNKKLTGEIADIKKRLKHLLLEVNIKPPIFDTDYLDKYLTSQYMAKNEELSHMPKHMTREQYMGHINQALNLLRQIRSKEYVINNPNQIL